MPKSRRSDARIALLPVWDGAYKLPTQVRQAAPWEPPQRFASQRTVFAFRAAVTVGQTAEYNFYLRELEFAAFPKESRDAKRVCYSLLATYEQFT